MLEETDWAMFYTQAKSIKTKAIVEIIMIEADVIAGTQKSRGIGYAEVPLFYDDMPPEVPVFKGSPRDMMKNIGEIGYEPPVTNSVLSFEVKKVPKLDWLMNLIPDNTLVGSSDSMPGLKDSILPKKFLEVFNPEICK